MVIPKKYSMSLTIAYERAIMVSPVRAATMRSRAPCVPDLSPPEVSHWRPPQTIWINTRTPAIINRSERMAPTNSPRLVIENCSIYCVGMSKPPGEAMTGEATKAKLPVATAVLVISFLKFILRYVLS